MCKVTGSRRNSEDLPQGDLEVPCTLKFQGKTKDIDKIKQLLETALCLASTQHSDPASKKRKLSSVEMEKEEPQSWIRHGGIILSNHDKANITRGEKLNDEHVNFAQQLLKAQFTSSNGLCLHFCSQRSSPYQSANKQSRSSIVTETIGLLCRQSIPMMEQ